MKITDVVSITELSRIMNKSRPTIYKYIEDYENEVFTDIPLLVKELFDSITIKGFTKKDIYNYCDMHFMENDELTAIIRFLKENKNKINLNRVMNFLRNEVL